jgi:TetR/AcrR family transcriptional regulator, cholesterol catabolism regulator
MKSKPARWGCQAGEARSGSSRVKKEQVVDVATDYFCRSGYEATKWAAVAPAVDLGSTALYHYFGSKHHCL